MNALGTIFRLAVLWRQCLTWLSPVIPDNKRNKPEQETITRLKAAILSAEFDNAWRIYQSALPMLSGLSSSIVYQLHAGKGDRASAFRSLKRQPLTKDMREALGARYIQSITDLERLPANAKVLILATSGPGDEIRNASFYHLLQLNPHLHITLTCDPKLHTLFCRSFPQFKVTAVNRLHRLWSTDNGAKLRWSWRLPKLSLYRAIDDRLWSQIEDFDAVVLASDLLGDLEERRPDGYSGAYLRAEAAKHGDFQRRLSNKSQQTKTPLVGFCWRSVFVNVQRNVHYMSLEEIGHILTQPACRFVVLQAGITTDERSWLNSRFADRLIWVDDVDPLDDLESFSALISCLDVVISPATYVIELAGALGVEGIFMSNSSINFYRHDAQKKDILFPTLTHCEPESVGEHSTHNVVEARRLLSTFINSGKFT